MSHEDLKKTIDEAFERGGEFDASAKGEVRDAVEAALELLDSGKARVAEKKGDDWIVNQWLKKAVLLSFRLTPTEIISGGPGGGRRWGKLPSKFTGWGAARLEAAGVRAGASLGRRRCARVPPLPQVCPG